MQHVSRIWCLILIFEGPQQKLFNTINLQSYKNYYRRQTNVQATGNTAVKILTDSYQIKTSPHTSIICFKFQIQHDQARTRNKNYNRKSKNSNHINFILCFIKHCRKPHRAITHTHTHLQQYNVRCWYSIRRYNNGDLQVGLFYAFSP